MEKIDCTYELPSVIYLRRQLGETYISTVPIIFWLMDFCVVVAIVICRISLFRTRAYNMLPSRIFCYYY